MGRHHPAVLRGRHRWILAAIELVERGTGYLRQRLQLAPAVANTTADDTSNDPSYDSPDHASYDSPDHASYDTPDDPSDYTSYHNPHYWSSIDQHLDSDVDSNVGTYWTPGGEAPCDC